jgi:hypothetical protein
MDSNGKPELPVANEDGACSIMTYNLMNNEELTACGRPLHHAPEGVDDKPVCLMHSNDPAKQTGPLFDDFWREFEAILMAAAEGTANFHGFTIPDLDLSGRIIQANCRFTAATFKGYADFSGATFKGDASFTGATFTQYANFSGVTFTLGTKFFVATFTQYAYFVLTTFAQNADFKGAHFTQRADFRKATFTLQADFSIATFAQDAGFYGATFVQNADFRKATFTLQANFSRANFGQNADFSEVTFTQDANFIGTKFFGTTYWMNSRFLENAEFRTTEFSPKVAGAPSTVFALAHFEKPGRITFDDVDLGRALFRDCDVSEVRFTSSVQWGNDFRELQIFAERIALDHKDAKGLTRNGERDFRAIAQIYQQLKKNYDTRMDYWTANQFHFGEMEMKRLALLTQGKLLRLRRWIHPRLSPVALYKKASDYGNNYWKPMLLLLGLLVLFALLFPWAGLLRSGNTYRETYSSVWRAGSSVRQRLWWETGLVGKSLLTAVDTATFQKGAEYAPAYPWGRALAILETLLTSSLFALFLLALRRQFRR